MVLSFLGELLHEIMNTRKPTSHKICRELIKSLTPDEFNKLIEKDKTIILLNLIPNAQDLVLVSIFVEHAIQEELNVDAIIKVWLWKFADNYPDNVQRWEIDNPSNIYTLNGFQEKVQSV